MPEQLIAEADFLQEETSASIFCQIACPSLAVVMALLVAG